MPYYAKPVAAFSSTRVRPGLYMVTARERTFHVEQIRTDLAGYGVENKWWVTACDSGSDPYFDPFYTKADALQAIKAVYVDPCQLHGEQPEAVCETCTAISG